MNPHLLKFFFLVLISIFIQKLALTQQLPLFTQHQENRSLINPAMFLNQEFGSYNPTKYKLSISGLYRKQWEIPDAPRTAYINAEKTFKIKKSDSYLTTGLSAIRDQTGPVATIGVIGRTSFLFSDNGFHLSGGLSGGILRYAFDAGEASLVDPNDPLGMSNLSRNSYTASGGVFLINNTFENNNWAFYAGVAVHQILANGLNTKNDNELPTLTQSRHFYSVAGMEWSGSEIFILEPSLWHRYVKGAPHQFSINAKIKFSTDGFSSSENYFWFGPGINLGVGNGIRIDGINAMVGGKFETDAAVISIGFGFSPSTQPYSPQFGSAYEGSFAVDILD